MSHFIAIVPLLQLLFTSAHTQSSGQAPKSVANHDPAVLTGVTCNPTGLPRANYSDLQDVFQNYKNDQVWSQRPSCTQLACASKAAVVTCYHGTSSEVQIQILDIERMVQRIEVSCCPVGADQPIFSGEAVGGSSNGSPNTTGLTAVVKGVDKC